jgi:dUTP pyrophosphatase
VFCKNYFCYLYVCGIKFQIHTMQILISNYSTNPLPNYQSQDAAGADIRAFLPEPVVLLPLQRCLIATGLHIELPTGFEAQVRPRSGLALQHGITVLNSPGTIDADYRGEIKVLLINLSNESYTIQNGDRIAQLIIAKHEQAEWIQTTELSITQRGAGGYGSTGKI